MSKAETVKAVSFNYMNFLWKEIGKIREAESQGNYALALKLATSLIAYLPDGIKQDFAKKTEEIDCILKALSANVKASDNFIAMVRRNHIVQVCASLLLKAFVNDLSSKLDGRGVYMEAKKPRIPTGIANEMR